MLAMELDRSARVGCRLPEGVLRPVRAICTGHWLSTLTLALTRDGALAFDLEGGRLWFMPGIRTDQPRAVIVSANGQCQVVGAVRKLFGFSVPNGRRVYRASDTGYYHPLVGFAPARMLRGSCAALVPVAEDVELDLRSVTELADRLSGAWYPMVAGSELLDDRGRLWYRFEHGGVETMTPNPPGAKPFAQLYSDLKQAYRPAIQATYRSGSYDNSAELERSVLPFVSSLNVGLARSSVNDPLLKRLWSDRGLFESVRAGECRLSDRLQVLVAYTALDGRTGVLRWRTDKPYVQWRGSVHIGRLLLLYELVTLHHDLEYSQVYSGWLATLPGSSVYVAPLEIDMRHILNANAPDASGVIHFRRPSELVRLRGSVLFVRWGEALLLYVPNPFVQQLMALGSVIPEMECD